MSGGKPIRILFVLGSLGGGGTERQVVEILKRLDRRRFTPLLYLIYRTGDLLPEVPQDVPIHFFAEQFRPPRFNWPGRLHAQHVRALSKTIRTQAIDLIYDRTIHATLVAGPAAPRAGVPHVSVVVNDPRMDLEASGQKFVVLKRIKLRRAYRRAARVFVVSAALGTSLQQYYGVPAEQIRTVYNLFDFEDLERRAMIPAPELEPNRFQIVAAGRLQEQKGFDTLLAAIDLTVHRMGHHTVHLRILGSGPLESSLRQSIIARDLQQHVELAGFHHNPLPLFRQSHLFCLTSLFEGMPNALVEAMACGTPAISTDCPSGPHEILAGGKFGQLVPPGNVEELAVAIDAAIRNYSTWKERSFAARRHVEQLFDAKLGIERLMKELEEVVRTV